MKLKCNPYKVIVYHINVPFIIYPVCSQITIPEKTVLYGIFLRGNTIQFIESEAQLTKRSISITTQNIWFTISSQLIIRVEEMRTGIIFCRDSQHPKTHDMHMVSTDVGDYKYLLNI